MQNKLLLIFCVLGFMGGCTCNRDNAPDAKTPVIRGIYSFGPELSTFIECGTGREFWITDSIEKLENAYSQQGFEKPYEPVYIEVKGRKKISLPNGAEGDYDSTVIVKELIRISKDIPENCQPK
ncbi:MAG: hypothetical protein INR69_24415 [Mucilaginibacter polytrichastri]|nr:hypothetical protein [Mucilaginibacter polytrichastri]